MCPMAWSCRSSCHACTMQALRCSEYDQSQSRTQVLACGELTALLRQKLLSAMQCPAFCQCRWIRLMSLARISLLPTCRSLCEYCAAKGSGRARRSVCRPV